MRTPNHTPGPWHVGLKPGPMVYGPQGEQIVGINVMLDRDEVLANAKFITAAPAMYLELYNAVKLLKWCRESHVWETSVHIQMGLDIERMETALAQAEGEL